MDLSKASSILIFGGTFDPPHRAHVVLPEQVRQQRGVDAIAYVPAGRAQHGGGHRGHGTLAVGAGDGDHRGGGHAREQLDVADALDARVHRRGDRRLDSPSRGCWRFRTDVKRGLA